MITLSGLNIKHGISDSKVKDIGHLIVANEPHPKNTIQLQINLTTDSMNEFAEDKVKFFDELMNF